MKFATRFTFSLIALLVLSSLSGHAQIGGRGTYSYLETILPARLAALGGTPQTGVDNDIQFTQYNPALINPLMHNQISLAFVDYFADVKFSNLQYSRTHDKLGSFTGSLQYHNYGKFDYADESGQRDGTFGAADYALMLGWGRRLDSNFSIGAQVKWAVSQYESYTSFGMAVDVAGIYHSPEGWQLALVARNIGSELKSFLPGHASTMPFSMSLAFSQRLEHLPLRFYVVYDHLQQWDLTYTDPIDLKGLTDPITGKRNERKGIEKTADQLMRHIVIGGELSIGRNLNLRGSYNYRRRQEMLIPEKPALVGFAWGVGIKVSKFSIDYSRATFHVVGSPNYLTVSTNLDAFR
ncbi:MAG TPA: type IX secretion system protein PorQ [Bacteroidales bacterium]|nr:type IX secretion system protein PorQ [Bacteroidales bacterium]